MLIAGRVLQGLVGGLLVPAGQTILGIVAGKGRLGRITGTIGIAIVVALLPWARRWAARSTST